MDTKYNKQHINKKSLSDWISLNFLLKAKIILKKEMVEAQDVPNPPKVIMHPISRR